MSDDKLFQKALEYILTASKTERQVRQWLFKKRKEGEFLDVDAIITRLKELGYINDAEYAKNFTETKQTRYGKKSIQQRLMQKGVDRESINIAVSEITDQTELATTLAEKYMRNKNADQKTMQKLYRFLLSKGFDYDTVNYVTNKYKVKGDHE